MGRAERRLILRSGGSAGWASLALGAIETSLVAGWGLLLFAVVRLLVGRMVIPAAPACYLVAVAFACLLERRSRLSRASPLTSLGLEAVSTSGDTPGALSTFMRILLTPPSLLAGMVGYIPLLVGARPAPEIMSRTMMLSLQPQLDPRPYRVMKAERRSSRHLVLSYSLVSVAAGLAVLLMPVTPRAPLRDPVDRQASGLSGEDGRLLVYYLDNVQRYPDSLEFHVRLASLYYRNDMEADLAVELGEIERLDPDHPMLLLEEDLSVDLEDLVTEEEAVSDSAAIAGVSAEAATDSGGRADSTATAVPDSSAADTTAGDAETSAEGVAGIASAADSSAAAADSGSAGTAAEAESTGPDQEAEAAGSEQEAEAAGPEQEAEATGSETEAGPTGSETEAGATESESEAESTGPETDAESTGSETATEAAGSETEAEATGSETEAGATESETAAEATGPETDAGAAGSENGEGDG